MQKRVLIVDDVEFSRDFEKSLIEKVAKEVGIDLLIDFASSVNEATSKIENNKDGYDYFIIDMNLPDGIGADIAKVAKEFNKDAKIAAMTIYPSRYIKYKKLFDLYLHKPMKPENYKEKLISLLKG